MGAPHGFCPESEDGEGNRVKQSMVDRGKRFKIKLILWVVKIVMLRIQIDIHLVNTGKDQSLLCKDYTIFELVLLGPKIKNINNK